jgi:hypothetical protein
MVVQSPVIPNEGVDIDRGALDPSGVAIVEADISNSDGSHDPVRMARVLEALLSDRSSATARMNQRST